jgi:hypothetical protein
VLWILLVGWVVLNVADWLTTAAALARAGSHEDNPLQAALLARGGQVALAAYKVLVIAGGAVLTPTFRSFVMPTFRVSCGTEGETHL